MRTCKARCGGPCLQSPGTQEAGGRGRGGGNGKGELQGQDQSELHSENLSQLNKNWGYDSVVEGLGVWLNGRAPA